MIIAEISETHVLLDMLLQNDSMLTRILKKQRFFFHITKDVLNNRLVRYGFLLS